ncbi:MAG: hypothetical protein HY943_22465 [Gammaproteobacteria bacterium]|nr:hypothetical protein [Gammaproteobacteria bacterium]
MLGLAILAVFAVYLWLTVVLARIATAYVRAYHLPGWIGGGTISLIMFLLVFWDWIPTAVAHHYYCSTRAGLKVYKTLEQWRAENPGVAETLVTTVNPKWVKLPNGSSYALDQRFERRMTERPVFLSVTEHLDAIYDVNSRKGGAVQEPLMVNTDYSSGTGWFPADAYTLHDYKFWLVSRSCAASGDYTNVILQDKFMTKLRAMERQPEPSANEPGGGTR